MLQREDLVNGKHECGTKPLFKEGIRALGLSYVLYDNDSCITFLGVVNQLKCRRMAFLLSIYSLVCDLSFGHVSQHS